MRCPDCNKFVPYDDSTEPEVDLDVEIGGAVTGTARIVLTCGECGTELKETTFDLDLEGDSFTTSEGKEFEFAKHAEEGHELSVECEGAELTSRTETTNPKTGKPISYRYARTYYGFQADLELSCSCGGKWSASAADECQASGMEEMV